MTHVQVIERDGKPAFYAVPADLWERGKGLVEDAEDAAAYAAALTRDDGVRYPATVARAIARGVYAATPTPGDPLPTWRDRFGQSG
jgi:hypothetical protein